MAVKVAARRKAGWTQRRPCDIFRAGWEEGAP
jgi:hypothetical protein